MLPFKSETAIISQRNNSFDSFTPFTTISTLQPFCSLVPCNVKRETVTLFSFRFSVSTKSWEQSVVLDPSSRKPYEVTHRVLSGHQTCTGTTLSHTLRWLSAMLETQKVLFSIKPLSHDTLVGPELPGVDISVATLSSILCFSPAPLGPDSFWLPTKCNIVW